MTTTRDPIEIRRVIYMFLDELTGDWQNIQKWTDQDDYEHMTYAFLKIALKARVQAEALATVLDDTKMYFAAFDELLREELPHMPRDAHIKLIELASHEAAVRWGLEHPVGQAVGPAAVPNIPEGGEDGGRGELQDAGV